MHARSNSGERVVSGLQACNTGRSQHSTYACHLLELSAQSCVERVMRLQVALWAFFFGLTSPWFRSSVFWFASKTHASALREMYMHV